MVEGSEAESGRAMCIRWPMPPDKRASSWPPIENTGFRSNGIYDARPHVQTVDIYDQNKLLPNRIATIAPNDVPGPGYHWYKLDGRRIGPMDVIFFFHEPKDICHTEELIRLDIGRMLPPDSENWLFEVWANFKYEGPAFPCGRADQANAIFVERIFVLKK